MKINTASSEVRTSGSLETGVATLELNAVIAHVLSRDLYTRPIEAAFREVLINALDAHVEAEAQVPVDVHLPTWSDSLVSIRDYGLGMSHEKMMKVYLDYGVSTRRDDNERHGGLGLGTKAPLAYVDSFSVTSFHAGEKRTYLIYYNEDGLPVRDLRSVEPTHETGLLVQFSIKHSSDASDFRSAARAILPWIPKDKYRLNIDLGLDQEPPAQMKRFGRMGLYSGRGLQVVMGYQRYDTDMDQLSVHLKKMGLRTDLSGHSAPIEEIITRLTANHMVTLFSDIGAMQPHPSRESVIVTRRTAEQIAQLAADGAQALFNLSVSGSGLTRDIEAYRLLGVLPPHDLMVDDAGAPLKFRCKLLVPPGYGYNNMLVVSEYVTSYEELIKQLSDLKHVMLAKLNQFDFTDLVGRSASRRRVDEVITGTTVVVVDVQTTAPRIVQTLDLTEVDLSDTLEKVRREDAQARANPTLNSWHNREVVRSMQDPSHNVITLDPMDRGGYDFEYAWRYGYQGFIPYVPTTDYDYLKGVHGSMKKHWTSAKMSVSDFGDTPVFWTETRMGVAADRGRVGFLSHQLARIAPLLEKREVPIILGLPASKGTKRFERAFPNIEEMDAWFEIVLERPHIRRIITAAKIYEMIANDWDMTTDLDFYIPFEHNPNIRRLCDYIRRAQSLLGRYDGWGMTEFYGLADILKSKAVYEDEVLQAYRDIRRAYVQFPYVSNIIYSNVLRSGIGTTTDSYNKLTDPQPFGSPKATGELVAEITAFTTGLV